MSDGGRLVAGGAVAGYADVGAFLGEVGEVCPVDCGGTCPGALVWP
jgi:hypothetical protein